MSFMTDCIQALEASHRHFNRELFGSRLSSTPVITIQRRGQINAHGWYAHDQWADAEENARAELNVCAEDLLLGPEKTLLALVHEMVHQRAHEKGIRDASQQGRYHNRRFKTLAEEAGLVAPARPDPRTGYAEVEWGPNGTRAFCGLDSRTRQTFVLARRLAAPCQNGKMLLFVCGCAPPYKVRTGRADFSALCTRCGQPLRRPGTSSGGSAPSVGLGAGVIQHFTLEAIDPKPHVARLPSPNPTQILPKPPGRSQ